MMIEQNDNKRAPRRDSRTHAMTRALANSKGMTLVEVLIVLTIIASIMGVVGVFVVGQLDNANIKTAALEISKTEGLINQYMLVSSPRRLPDSLDDLVKQNLTKKINNDPWGAPYVYRKVNNREFELFSVGPDGQEGTDDDIRNDQ